MEASRHTTRQIEDTIGAPEGMVTAAWEFVRRHPLPTLGAVAAGVGTYVLLSKLDEKPRGAHGRDGARGGRRQTRASSRARSSASRAGR